MGFWKTLTRAAGLGLCAVAFTGSALADPGNGNGNGNGGTPPGQEQKEQAAPAPAPATPAPAPQAASAPGQAKKADEAAVEVEAKTEHKSERQAPPKSEAKSHAKTEAKADTSKGESADAHHHVIICHRTGSLSNPYVVINIPYTAWLHAHSDTTGSHPDLNGNHDKLLKDPASRPGSKDGFSKAACGGAVARSSSSEVTPASTKQSQPTGCAAGTTTERVIVGVWHATGAYKDGKRKYVYITPSLTSAHHDQTKHSDDIPVYEDRAVTVTAAAVGSPGTELEFAL